jgi:hypothetical protein
MSSFILGVVNTQAFTMSRVEGVHATTAMER